MSALAYSRPLVRLLAAACCLLSLLLVGATTAPATARADVPEVEQLACGQDLARSDENGTLYLRFQCFPEHAVINWGFALSPALRTIIAGPVRERGLDWWRNGHAQPQNSPHLRPADYHFHGTMNPVFVGEFVDYQDVLVFGVDYRGQPGTGRVVFAGSVHLTL